METTVLSCTRYSPGEIASALTTNSSCTVSTCPRMGILEQHQLSNPSSSAKVLQMINKRSLYSRNENIQKDVDVSMHFTVGT